MGTRADFYIGRGESAKWLGSVGWDGYPSGIAPKLGEFEKAKHLFDSVTEEEFRERLEQYFSDREDVTRPEQGWPWPWEDSGTSDYAYAFEDGRVFASCFGSAWFDPRKEEPEGEEGGKLATFPNMKALQNVTFGKRSGVVFVTKGLVVNE